MDNNISVLLNGIMKKISIQLIIILLLVVPMASAVDKGKTDIWVPMAERIKIWDAVAGKGKYTISKNGIEATFEKDGAQWTIMGANAPIVNPTVYPKDWPVKGNDFEVLVIPEPITNYKILPFTEKIENAVKSDTISITAAKDTFEPASFVIRSGDADLKDVMIEATDLKAEIKGRDGKIENAIFPKENIDVRLVKCWYQAGKEIDDNKHKLLTPELLLHDDNLVRVDYNSQVNMVRDFAMVEDAASLKRFGVAKKQNKQVWLTARITDKLESGKYSGIVKITSGKSSEKNLKIEIEVLPFVLPEPMLDYALYYEGRLSGSDTPVIEAGLKTEKQMKAELEDMKAHGLTNATVWHQVNEDKAKWSEDWKRLQKTLYLRAEVGWASKPLFYLDWKVLLRTDPDLYKGKIQKIKTIAENQGIKDIYIYGVDEKVDKELAHLNDTVYKNVHAVGAKNFVAGYIDHFINYADNIDLPVVNGHNATMNDTLRTKIVRLKKNGRRIFIYHNPQAGKEEPDTYRNNFGLGLVKLGADGALNYAYQTGPCWNDWTSEKWRSHTMAYPTIFAPIPTIQWEGWRAGVDDVRYLSLLKQRNMESYAQLMANPTYDRSCRQKAISALFQ
jgi:hypothetical protein